MYNNTLHEDVSVILLLINYYLTKYFHIFLYKSFTPAVIWFESSHETNI